MATARPPSPPPAPGVQALSSQRSQRLHEAHEALTDGRPQDALAICDAEMRPDEHEVDWLLLRAATQHALDRDVESLPDLIAALRLDPASAEALFRTGRALMALDEPAHAERYLELAVKLSGGKKGYQALLRKAHKKALTETASLGGAGSALPLAEEDLGDDTGRSQPGKDAAVQRLLVFEQESGLFASRLESALGATRRGIDGLRRSSTVRRALLGGGIGLVALAVVSAVVALSLRSCRSQQATGQILATIDGAIRGGGSVARAQALPLALQLHDDSGDVDMALRAVWLLTARYIYDDADPALLEKAQALLDENASSDEPRVVLGAALLAIARGHPPGALVSETEQKDPLDESLRLELLALAGLPRGIYDQVHKWVDAARQSRPESRDLAGLALRAALHSDDIKRAEGLLKQMQQVAAGSPEAALGEAWVRVARGDSAAEVSPLLALPVKSDATRLRFGALALAVTLRAWVGNAAREAPPFDDIEAAIGGDRARALAASQSLLDEGWPDYAERALRSAGLAPEGPDKLALAVASSDVAGAAALLDQTNVQSVAQLGELAVLAAAIGDLGVVDACLARLEILGVSACEQAAARARVALRRGQKIAAATQITLDSCPAAGSVLLYHAERAASATKPIQEREASSLRQRLLRARGLGLARYGAAGELAMARDEPALADEDGRTLRVRRADSRQGLVLQLRAALTGGDYPKLLKLYQEAPPAVAKDPLVVGYAALGRVTRGEEKTAVRFLDDSGVPDRDRGLGLTLAARSLATLSSRTARKQIEVLRTADPSPYLLEALARALETAGEHEAALRALALARQAPERRLYLELLAAEIAFARADRREYRRALQAAEKKGREQNNTPVVLEAQLRRIAVIESAQVRREALEPLAEALNDQARYDRDAPYLRRLQRLLGRARSRQLEFPKL